MAASPATQLLSITSAAVSALGKSSQSSHSSGSSSGARPSPGYSFQPTVTRHFEQSDERRQSPKPQEGGNTGGEDVSDPGANKQQQDVAKAEEMVDSANSSSASEILIRSTVLDHDRSLAPKSMNTSSDSRASFGSAGSQRVRVPRKLLKEVRSPFETEEAGVAEHVPAPLPGNLPPGEENGTAESDVPSVPTPVEQEGQEVLISYIKQREARADHPRTLPASAGPVRDRSQSPAAVQPPVSCSVAAASDVVIQTVNLPHKVGSAAGNQQGALLQQGAAVEGMDFTVNQDAPGDDVKVSRFQLTEKQKLLKSQLGKSKESTRQDSTCEEGCPAQGDQTPGGCRWGREQTPQQAGVRRCVCRCVGRCVRRCGHRQHRCCHRGCSRCNSTLLSGSHRSGGEDVFHQREAFPAAGVVPGQVQLRTAVRPAATPAATAADRHEDQVPGTAATTAAGVAGKFVCLFVCLFVRQSDQQLHQQLQQLTDMRIKFLEQLQQQQLEWQAKTAGGMAGHLAAAETFQTRPAAETAQGAVPGQPESRPNPPSHDDWTHPKYVPVQVHHRPTHPAPPQPTPASHGASNRFATTHATQTSPLDTPAPRKHPPVPIPKDNYQLKGRSILNEILSHNDALEASTVRPRSPSPPRSHPLPTEPAAGRLGSRHTSVDR
ncbi:uncharacterized protein LOC118421037 [Branchiostoma floridae]|uniref:Uncharacterized protein LOC118421037 n=1 Tax=Branchiostoma floridae TaxID=7739 RepID=A0A9J7MZ21_BRAFL|nr:uncharacterized protein LOC118421037 [Branchiostoma floridae]